MSKRTDKEDVERELLMHVAKAGMFLIFATELGLNKKSPKRVLHRTLTKAVDGVPELKAFFEELKTRFKVIRKETKNETIR